MSDFLLSVTGKTQSWVNLFNGFLKVFFWHWPFKLKFITHTQNLLELIPDQPNSFHKILFQCLRRLFGLNELMLKRANLAPKLLYLFIEKQNFWLFLPKTVRKVSELPPEIEGNLMLLFIEPSRSVL